MSNMSNAHTKYVLVATLGLASILGHLYTIHNPPNVSAQIDSVRPVTKLQSYDGSNNLEYVCTANAYQPTYKYQIALSNLTNIVDSANTGTVNATAHGLEIGNLVIISGATTDADLNGSYYVATVPNANSFTITTANVSDATYTDAAMVISTNAPRNTAAIWQIQKYSYSTTYRIREQSSRPRSICANRAVTTGATKVTYE